MSPQTLTIEMKPYRQVPIQECGEPLVAIPLRLFAVETPHPYIKCGADYQGKSPYYLRQGVLDRLIQAQERLQQLQPGWKLQILMPIVRLKSNSTWWIIPSRKQ